MMRLSAWTSGTYILAVAVLFIAVSKLPPETRHFAMAPWFGRSRRAVPAAEAREEDDRLLRLQEVLILSGMKRSTIYLHVHQGRFPPPRKVGRLSLWSHSELQDWIASRPVANLGPDKGGGE